jgi:hypothetical protein
LPSGGIGGAVQAESGGREARRAECGVIELFDGLHLADLDELALEVPADADLEIGSLPRRPQQERGLSVSVVVEPEKLAVYDDSITAFLVLEWVGSPPTLESRIGGRWNAWRGYFSVISRI